MGADDGGVDKEVAGEGARPSLQVFPEPAPDAAPFPAAKAGVHRVPLPKVLRQVAPWGIGMKLSIDRFRKGDGFLLLTQTFLQDLRGCPSFSRRLGCQPFGGGTDTCEHPTQGELGLEDGLHPTGGKGLEMAHEFEETQCTLFLHPELRTHLWTEGIREENEEHATIQIT